MGAVDVSDVVSDPDLIDSITIVHREPTISQYGENLLEERGVPTYGSVQPASGKTLERLPDALRVAGVNSFWVRGKIISDGQCQYPDILVFKGARYAVQVVMDWTSWGAGWSEGLCIREKPTVG